MKLYKIELRLYNYDDNVKTETYMQELSITDDALERIKLIQSKEGKGFLRITVDSLIHLILITNNWKMI